MAYIIQPLPMSPFRFNSLIQLQLYIYIYICVCVCVCVCVCIIFQVLEIAK